VWLIEDPGLRLGDLKAIQDEVAHLLGSPDPASPAPVRESAAPETSA
jgi:hypothetical protein